MVGSIRNARASSSSMRSNNSTSWKFLFAYSQHAVSVMVRRRKTEEPEKHVLCGERIASRKVRTQRTKSDQWLSCVLMALTETSCSKRHRSCAARPRGQPHVGVEQTLNYLLRQPPPRLCLAALVRQRNQSPSRAEHEMPAEQGLSLEEQNRSTTP